MNSLKSLMSIAKKFEDEYEAFKSIDLTSVKVSQNHLDSLEYALHVNGSHSLELLKRLNGLNEGVEKVESYDKDESVIDVETKQVD